MRKVLILSEDRAVRHKPEPDAVLIRIKEAPFRELPFAALYVEILTLEIDDIDFELRDHILMNEDHAQVIVDFMEHHRARNLITHCQGGVSRSSAIACAWYYMHNDPESEAEVRTSKLYDPNKHIYRMLKEEIDRRLLRCA